MQLNITNTRKIWRNTDTTIYFRMSNKSITLHQKNTNISNIQERVYAMEREL